MIRGIAMMILSWSMTLGAAFAQNAEERIIVDMRGTGFFPKEIEMMIVGNNHYLPALEAFTLFGIKSQYDSVRQRITGFFRNSDSTFKKRGLRSKNRSQLSGTNSECNCASEQRNADFRRWFQP